MCDIENILMQNMLAKDMKKLGQTRLLSHEQEQEIFRLITTRRPFQIGFKLPYKNALQYLWTRKLILKLIEREFNLELTDDGLVKYLVRWGFPKVNRAISKHQQCEKPIRDWLDVNFESLCMRARDESAELIWLGNLMPIDMQQSLSVKPKKLTMIPVIANQGQLSWVTISGKFTPEKQLMFLKSLVGQFRSKIYLIRNTDQHFKVKLVNNWLKSNQIKIEIIPPLVESLDTA